MSLTHRPLDEFRTLVQPEKILELVVTYGDGSKVSLGLYKTTSVDAASSSATALLKALSFVGYKVDAIPVVVK